VANVILAVLGRESTTRAVLEAARNLSVLLGEANITALAVEKPSNTSGLEASTLIAEAAEWAAARDRERQRIWAIENLFDHWAAEARRDGLVVLWRGIVGSSRREVMGRGRLADLIVIARPSPDDDLQIRGGFRAALLHTDRPVLVVPPGGSEPFGSNVAIAWHDDSRAAKTVLPALRFLSGASQVHVLQGVRDGAARLPVPRVLQDRGIVASVHVLPIKPPFGQMLLEKVHSLKADLLVMGAYSRSRWREIVFGGVTQFMLEHADLPVLMRH
jgi:nucleotide-binding universal stress UspA family protein